MKIAVATLFVAAQALSTVCAAPQFVSQYEDDGKALTQSRKEGGSLFDRLREDKRFSRFVEILEKERGLKDDLENRDSETTVFAPTNDAFKRMEDEWNSRSEEDRPNIRDVLKYHIAPDAQISGDCLHAGALIPTNLRLKSLDDRHQRVRVFRFHDNIWLNMHSRIVEKDIKASNGRVHAIDHVLCPPKGVTEMLYTVPTSFSTTISALERTGLACDINGKEKAITVFAPSNQAWENLGYANLKFLFSCVGQKEERERRGSWDEKERQPWCKGTEELKKIMEFHIATELAYSTDMMKKKSMTMKTLCGSKLQVCAKRREGQREERDEDSKHQDVRQFNFVVNDGEARVKFTDGLAKNGAIQVIDNILIPKNVKLPHDSWMQMM